MRARAGGQVAPPRRRAARVARHFAAQGARAPARGRRAGVRRYAADARRTSGAVAALLRRPQMARTARALSPVAGKPPAEKPAREALRPARAFVRAAAR